MNNLSNVSAQNLTICNLLFIVKLSYSLKILSNVRTNSIINIIVITYNIIIYNMCVPTLYLLTLRTE